MPSLESYRDLTAWQKSMDLAVQCYQTTKTLPRQEMFGLGFQIRKSSVSVASNIAEGFNRRSNAAYINHLTIALGSEGELSTQIELALRTGLISRGDAARLLAAVSEVGRLVNGLIGSLRRRRDMDGSAE